MNRERLSVGTVPTNKMRPVGAVPTYKLNSIGTVPTYKMHPVGILIFCQAKPSPSSSSADWFWLPYFHLMSIFEIFTEIVRLL